jgi:hypothetical protein
MSDYPGITTLNLGNTFGAWYNKTNELITRTNTLQVGSITAGDGLIVSKHPSIAGGYTLSISNTINKNVTFLGDVDIQGTLSYAYGGEATISAIALSVPIDSGITVGNIVYIDSDGIAQKAIANDECSAEVLGIVVGFTGSNAQVAVSGKISGSSTIANFLGITGGTLQKGTVYFLSSGISGAGTTLQPNAIENVSKPVLLGITSDVGIILPYRGFKGVTSSGSFTSYGGLCGGYSGPIVTSINSANSYRSSSQRDYEQGISRTSGDVLGINSITYFYDGGEGTVTIDSYGLLFDRINYVIPWGGFANYISNPLNSGKRGWRQSQTTSAGVKEIELEVPKTNIKRYNLFSTSGITTDVWRLKNIKVHVEETPLRSFSFSLIRVINRLGNTNYSFNTNSDTSGVEEAPGKLGIRFGIQEISGINARVSVNGSANSITSLTILEPKTILPFKVFFDGVTYSGDGSTAGDLRITPNWSTFSGAITTNDGRILYGQQNPTPGNGKYPIIYGAENLSLSNLDDVVSTLSNRNYTWIINSHIVGNTGDQKLVSEIIKSSVEGNSIDFDGTLSGITMDTAILGWNATYGAVSEGLYIHLYDSEITKPIAGIGTIDGTEHQKTGTIYLEMTKLDINTLTESGPVIIPVRFERDLHYIKNSGKDITTDNRRFPPGTEL